MRQNLRQTLLRKAFAFKVPDVAEQEFFFRVKKLVVLDICCHPHTKPRF